MPPIAVWKFPYHQYSAQGAASQLTSPIVGISIWEQPGHKSPSSEGVGFFASRFLEVNFPGELHNPGEILLSLRQLPEVAAKLTRVAEPCVRTGTNGGIGYIKCFGAELESITLAEANGFFQGYVQLRFCGVADIGKAIRKCPWREGFKKGIWLRVAASIVVKPVIFILRARNPRSARIDDVGPPNRVSRRIGHNPVKPPIADDCGAHPVFQEPSTSSEGQVPNSVESKRMGLVSIVQFMNQRLT